MVKIILNVFWLITSIFMILLVLIQRGRGGGLAGAFGGVGGSSAFGTKTGDVFTRVTVGVFLVWVVTGMVLVRVMSREMVYRSGSQAGDAAAVTTNPDAPPVPEGLGGEGAPIPPVRKEASPPPAPPVGASVPAKSDQSPPPASKEAAKESSPPAAKKEASPKPVNAAPAAPTKPVVPNKTGD